MLFIALLAVLALAVAATSLTRLSRLPTKLPPVEERSFDSLRAGDVVLTPKGDYLVTARSELQGASLVELESGRERRFLLAGSSGPVAFLDTKPEGADVEREAARTGGSRLDRATVELLPGA